VDVTIPPLQTLIKLLQICDAGGVVAAVGGSALLGSLGLVDIVHDWDVTTDAATALVRAALDELALPVHDRTIHSPPYRSRRLLTVDSADHSIDVIVGFALLDGGGRVIELPTRVCGHWRGLPMGDPIVWQRAYTLLGRLDRAELLRTSIASRAHERTDAAIQADRSQPPKLPTR
jgi:hypothetical protein